MATPQTQGTKQAAPAPEFLSPPEAAIKRTRRFVLNSLAVKKMGYHFQIPAITAKMQMKTDQPFNAGMALGMMHYYIVPLISTHLENAVEFRNRVPEALIWATGFVEAIDGCIAYLRLIDGCSEKFPNDITVDRKSRRLRRKYMERYTYLVEDAYKDHVREQPCDVFQSWNQEQTQLFNKGVDKALSGIQWVVYPKENVVLNAGEDGWAIWLAGEVRRAGHA